MRLFFQETIFPGGIFLDTKLRDKEAHKIKILRNPKTSTQNKTILQFQVLSVTETQK